MHAAEPDCFRAPSTRGSSPPPRPAPHGAGVLQADKGQSPGAERPAGAVHGQPESSGGSCSPMLSQPEPLQRAGAAACGKPALA